jgi:hypothetical protein
MASPAGSSLTFILRITHGNVRPLHDLNHKQEYDEELISSLVDIEETKLSEISSSS